MQKEDKRINKIPGNGAVMSAAVMSTSAVYDFGDTLLKVRIVIML